MSNSTSLFLGVLFGAIGSGYLVYGMKQRRGVALLSGVALCAFPYFVSNIVLSLFLGAVFMAVPFFIRY